MEAEVEGPDLPVQRRPAVLQSSLRPPAGFLQDDLAEERRLEAGEERTMREEMEEDGAGEAALVAGDGDVGE